VSNKNFLVRMTDEWDVSGRWSRDAGTEMRTGVELRHKTQSSDLLEKFRIDFTKLIYSYILCVLSWGWGRVSITA
jgi:hypothetical protein